MNEMQEMHKFLVTAFSKARIELAEPSVKNGVWWLDVFLEDYHLAAAWQKGKGFGLVSDDSHGYGEGADEVYEGLDIALPRVVQLLTYKLVTLPPLSIRLKELREELGLSQEEVASRLGKKQASVSRTEARSDYLVSTLREYAEALGARLSVRLVFPDASERELRFE